MSVLLFILLFLFGVGAGVTLTLLIVAAIVHSNIKDGEGVYVTFSPKSDRWMVFGDVDETLNKMRSHYKEPDKFGKRELEKFKEDRKAKLAESKRRRWYRK